MSKKSTIGWKIKKRPLIFLDSRGFSLVEVLIAAVILFSALSLGTLAYRTSVRVIDRFAASAAVADAVPQIMAQVNEQLMAQKAAGRGRFGKKIEYTWDSKVVKTSKNILSTYDETTGGTEYGNFMLNLNQIDLSIVYRGEGAARKRKYRYLELSWQNQPK